MRARVFPGHVGDRSVPDPDRPRSRMRNLSLERCLHGFLQTAGFRLLLRRGKAAVLRNQGSRGRHRPRPREPGKAKPLGHQDDIVSGRVFSVILLPTSECNVACDYCFEHKEPHRLSSVLVPLLTRRLLDHLEHEGIEECEIYWQGGEAMIMGPAWFADAGGLMDRAATERGRRFVHYLQT